MRSAGAAALAAATLLAAAAAAAAQARPALVIEHADQVQRLAQGDSVSYYLDGNVRARRGDLRLTAQHAVVLEWLGLLDLTRDVHLWDPETELYADHVTYTDSIDLAIATGNVQVIERATGSELQAQQVVYDRPAGVMTATQKPEMVLLPESDAESEDPGGRAPESAAASVPDSAAAAPPDSAVAVTTADTISSEQAAEPDSAVPIRVWSEQVQLSTEGDEVLATGDVLIRRGEDLVAKADTARRSGAEEVLRLRGSPRVETDRFYVEGGEIDVLLPEDELEALVARGQARASSVADSIPPAAVAALGSPSANSWLAADTLRFLFDDETLRSIRATGSARSLNYGLESRAGDAVTWSLNYLLAGRIALHFAADGEALQRVEASQQGRGVHRTAALAGEQGLPVAPGTADTTRVDTTAATVAGTGGAGAPAAADSVVTDTTGVGVGRPAAVAPGPGAPPVTAISDTLPLAAPPPPTPPESRP